MAVELNERSCARFHTQLSELMTADVNWLIDRIRTIISRVNRARTRLATLLHIVANELDLARVQIIDGADDHDFATLEALHQVRHL